MIQFILGMLTIQMFFPLIDGLTALILSALEAAKGYFGIKVAEFNIRIHQLAEEKEPKKRPIGFVREEEEDE